MMPLLQKTARSESERPRKLHFAWLLLMPLVLMLSGCGAYYNVTVDSLSDTGSISAGNPCYLQPGQAGVAEDDLMFRDVCRMLTPAFAAQGMTLTRNLDEARSVAHISYWEDAPRSTWVSGTTRRSVPVIVRDGRKKKVEYVYVDQPTLTEHTIYTAELLIEAFEYTPQGEGKALWRTSVRCSGSNDHMRTLLTAMMPALQRTLGRQTPGGANFEVFISDNGEISIDEVRGF